MRIFALPLALALHGLNAAGRVRRTQDACLALLKERMRGRGAFLLQAAALEKADSLSLFFIFFKKK